MRRCAHSLPATLARTPSRTSPSLLRLPAVQTYGLHKRKIVPPPSKRRPQRGPGSRSETRRHIRNHRSQPFIASLTMRFDMFRRRPAPPPSPAPPSPAPSTRSASGFRDSFYDATHSSPPPLKPVLMSRPSYMRNLQARMEQMERVPTRSFFQSYAGEFDMLQGEDRRAFRREHEFETSTKIENSYRNRYANVLSNEPTRVKLQDIAPGENDYINANLVRGFEGHPGYIATQAPLPETMPHFWQMVYESVTPVIIMLTREQEDHCTVTKSERYWPAVGEDLLFDHYLVHGLEESVNRAHGITERRFQVARVVDSRKKHAKDLVDADSLIPHCSDGTVLQTPARGRSQSHCDEDSDDCEDNEELMRHLEAIGTVLEVVQLQYTDWPDQEVPENPHTLLDLVRRVDSLCRTQRLRTGVAAPPVVHCSAGVGRTGTFIAIDKALRRLWDAFSHPIGAGCQPVCVEEIRELVRGLKNDRSRMVQTAEQYRFIYEAVLAGLKRWEAGHLTFPRRITDSSQASNENGRTSSQALDDNKDEELRSQAHSSPRHSSSGRGSAGPIVGHSSRIRMD